MSILRTRVRMTQNRLSILPVKLKRSSEFLRAPQNPKQPERYYSVHVCHRANREIHRKLYG